MATNPIPEQAERFNGMYEYDCQLRKAQEELKACKSMSALRRHAVEVLIQLEKITNEEWATALKIAGRFKQLYTATDRQESA